MSSRAVAASGRRFRFTARAVVLLVIMGALLVAAIFPVRTYLAERRQIAQLEERAGELESQNTRLERKIDKLHDPEYLEKLARECLGMVRPGEIAFVVVPKESAARPRSC